MVEIDPTEFFEKNSAVVQSLSAKMIVKFIVCMYSVEGGGGGVGAVETNIWF